MGSARGYGVVAVLALAIGCGRAGLSEAVGDAPAPPPEPSASTSQPPTASARVRTPATAPPRSSSRDDPPGPPPPPRQRDAAVVEPTEEPPPDASAADDDAGRAPPTDTTCCQADGTATDCSDGCVPIDVAFTPVWPCPYDVCIEEVRFRDGFVVVAHTEGASAGPYHCHGTMVLGVDGEILGRYDPQTELLLFRDESYCASDACRALWDMDLCATLYDGRWQGDSTGCLLEDPYEPLGCPYDLTFEPTSQGPLPAPAGGPICIVWGDDFTTDDPLTCENNVGTCGNANLRIHPTLGIEYGGRWHPTSLSPCEQLTGRWTATRCSPCPDDPDDASCTVTFEIDADGSATLDGAAGQVACTGTSFRFFPDGIEPFTDAWYAAGAEGWIRWHLDAFELGWNANRWRFVRAR